MCVRGKVPCFVAELEQGIAEFFVINFSGTFFLSCVLGNFPVIRLAQCPFDSIGFEADIIKIQEEHRCNVRAGKFVIMER
jgi:hypothetical protein